MKSRFFNVIFFLAFPFFSSAFSITQVRSLYQKAATEEKSCTELISLLKPWDAENNPLLAGYKACASMMMAKYTINPIRKLSYFIKGINALEKAITADKANSVLRFLRFGIQTNIPFFLGYKENIHGDKSFLLDSISHLNDLELKTWIISYLNESNNLTFTEKQNIK
jgi:hypothetical protein